MKKNYAAALLITAAVLLFTGAAPEQTDAQKKRTAERQAVLNSLENRLNAYRADSKYADDSMVLVTVREAMDAVKEGNGGIGCCLLDKKTGKILVQSHNRQFVPYFRSDLHGEMDLLDKYEDSVKKTRQNVKDLRDMTGIVLYTSVEPCSMCLARIINSGIKEVVYAHGDPAGCLTVEQLPGGWQRMGKGLVIRKADCSDELRELASGFFRPGYLYSGKEKK